MRATRIYFVDLQIGLDRAFALADQIGLVGLEPVQRQLVLFGIARRPVLMFSSLAARKTRMAISLRLATRIFLIGIDGPGTWRRAAARGGGRRERQAAGGPVAYWLTVPR